MLAFLLLGAQAPVLPKVTLTLTADKSIVPIGSIPKFTLHLKNASSSTITLVGCLDGSQEGMRYPYCLVQYADEENWKADPVGRCGNTNNLQVSDFLELGPGQKWSPAGEWFDWSRIRSAFQSPGAVKVRFVYDTSSAELSKWLGFMGPVSAGDQAQLRTKLDKVPKGRWESNVVLIRVVNVP